MKRKTLLAAAVLTGAAMLYYGCGGSSSSSNNASAQKVAASAEASKIKGAEICVKNTNNCGRTDENGTVTLTVNSLPVTLTLKLGGITFGEVNAASPYVPINPLTLAANNDTVAQTIGALIHALAGDTSGSKDKLDFSNITIETPVNGTIVSLIKEGTPLTLTVRGEDGDHTVTVDASNGTVSFDNETVSYSHDSTYWQAKELLMKLVSFAQKYDGKTIRFSDDNSTCVLIYNPEFYTNPDKMPLFKFTNCSDPDNNDNTWEIVEIDNSSSSPCPSSSPCLKVTDEDNVTTYIDCVNVEAGRFQYLYSEDGSPIYGYATVVSSSEEESGTSSGGYSSGYSGEEESGTSSGGYSSGYSSE